MLYKMFKETDDILKSNDPLYDNSPNIAKFIAQLKTCKSIQFIRKLEDEYNHKMSTVNQHNENILRLNMQMSSLRHDINAIKKSIKTAA